MDFSVLLTVPVIAIAVALVLFSGLISHAFGKNNETKRKISALAEAAEKAKAEQDALRVEQQEQIGVLNKAHQTLVDSLKDGHSGEIERLGNEHSVLIDKLNAANIANINELKAGQERQVAEINQRSTAQVRELKSETAATIVELKNDQQASIQVLREDHSQTLSTLKQDSDHAIHQAEQERDRRIAELQLRNTEEVVRLNGQLSELGEERDGLNSHIGELDETVAKLENDIKEAKLQNMFSVSKSGEKLVRVVRSVQELASELDETSRAVTGGEYSFFEEIKDQRDKEAVLSLTGGGGAYAHGHANVDESAIDGETDPAADMDAAGADADEKLPGGDETVDLGDGQSGEAKVPH